MFTLFLDNRPFALPLKDRDDERLLKSGCLATRFKLHRIKRKLRYTVQFSIY